MELAAEGAPVHFEDGSVACLHLFTKDDIICVSP